MREERLLQVILGPHVSEKTANLGDSANQVTFKVAVDATKPEIAAAVKALFEVDVERVNVSNVKGKAKRHGRFMGKRSNWKKAYVQLAEGQEIDFLGSE
jgi:large subunit ribosomal protein L23